MQRSIVNYMYHIFHREPSKWRPLLAVFYLTYECDFRCPYCCDGHGTPYHQLAMRTLPAEKILDLLRTIHRYSDYLVITGGEPLKHEAFEETLKGAASIGFDGIVLTTNGHDVDLSIETIAKTVDHLVFSLDTLDHAKAERMFGRAPGTLKTILSNIELAANHPNPRYEIIISSVMTPDNIEDLYQVQKFASDHRFRFAVSPQLVGVKPHEQLINNGASINFFNALLKAKKKGQRINGGLLYLQKMRDLTRFRCRPSTVLAVSPGGDVFYPCLERGTVGGNLLDTPDLDLIRKNAQELLGPEPKCGNQCHSPCALGLSMILNRPCSLLSEAYYYMKSKWH